MLSADANEFYLPANVNSLSRQRVLLGNGLVLQLIFKCGLHHLQKDDLEQALQHSVKQNQCHAHLE